MDTRYRLLETNLGHLAIVGTNRGLRRVYLPQRRGDLLRHIKSESPGCVCDNKLLPRLADDLRRYCAGRHPVEFKVRFDWDSATDFLRDIWQACFRIKYGRTITYTRLAERAGHAGAARAVGTAMAHNHCPIVVPCHRVLRSDGALGGYSSPGGISFKQRLLDMEATARNARQRRSPRR
ncbi:MAG: methylated-DNA--[protein]-cysteine S-methyltransferase [Planctomycetota bacterium]